MKLRQPLLIATLALLISACSTADLGRSGLLHPGVDSPSELYLQASRIRALNPAELATEAEKLQKTYVAQRNEESRLRLALFLSLAPTPHTDRARALSLLDVAASESNGRGRNHPLAQLLLPLLQENRRLDDSLTQSLQKQRELQQSNDAMRQKLDAIREIEVKMQERPKAK